ncbi:MAG: alpha-E domain-containing protein [Polyangiaceae bacterium]
MLSRVAEALYWMGRYIERAEHSARVLEAMRDLRLDLYEVNREVADEQWKGALFALSLPDLPIDRLVLDPGEPNSLLCAMSRARENARQVREVISPEMWEKLNQQYWVLREATTRSVNESMVAEALTGIVSSGFLWDGVTDATMIRGEGWLFLKLGKFVERIDAISRLVAARLSSATPDVTDEHSGNVEWLTLLKSFDALDAYRKAHPKRVDRRAVVEFLLFETEFPHTLRYSTNTAADLARRLLRLHPQSGRGVERDFGRVAARVEYADFDSASAPDSTFLREVVQDVNAGSICLQKTFFLC